MFFLPLCDPQSGHWHTKRKNKSTILYSKLCNLGLGLRIFWHNRYHLLFGITDTDLKLRESDVNWQRFVNNIIWHVNYISYFKDYDYDKMSLSSSVYLVCFILFAVLVYFVSRFSAVFGIFFYYNKFLFVDSFVT